VPLHQAEYRVRRHDGLWVWIKSDADKLSGPMAKRNTGKMEPETK
jgi:hypothetical protein